jgi:PAS domain-containing protein
MSIKIKLTVGIILFISAVVAFAGGIYFINEQLADAEQKRNLASELVFSVFERNIFFHNYLITPNERVTQQLLSRHSDIGKHLADAFILFDDQDDILQLRLMEKHHNLITVGIGRLIEDGGSDGGSPESYARRVSQNLTQSQSTSNIAQRLSETYSEKISNLRILGNRLLIVFLSLSLVLSAGASVVMIGIMKSITKLRTGVEIIARGDTKHRITIATRDEIGELARSFNTMTENLVGARSLPENILRSMKDGLFVVDTKGNITQVNQAALEVSGYNKDELVGKPISGIFSKNTKLPQEPKSEISKSKVLKYVPAPEEEEDK